MIYMLTILDAMKYGMCFHGEKGEETKITIDNSEVFLDDFKTFKMNGWFVGEVNKVMANRNTSYEEKMSAIEELYAELGLLEEGTC